MQIYLPIAEVSVNAFLLLGLGGIVGLIVLSIMLPILQLNTLAIG